MSFAAHLAAADLAALDVLGGGLVRYAPRIGAAVEVRGVFDDAYLRAELGGVEVSTSVPKVFLPAAEVAKLPSNPAEDDPEITVAGVPYRVREVQKDGQGGLLLLLREA